MGTCIPSSVLGHVPISQSMLKWRVFRCDQLASTGTKLVLILCLSKCCSAELMINIIYLSMSLLVQSIPFAPGHVFVLLIFGEKAAGLQEDSVQVFSALKADQVKKLVRDGTDLIANCCCG